MSPNINKEAKKNANKLHRDRLTPTTPPTILFEDTHLIVIDKPAGLLSQGEETGDPNLVDWARTHFGRHYVGLVHRLDRNTSGAMVLAKRTKSAQRLTEALQKGTLERTYLAWLVGELDRPRRWEHLLVKDERTNTVRAHPHGSGGNLTGAKPSALTVSPLGRAEWRGLVLTLAEFRLETGRSHQIRAQAAAERLPLLGDVKYGLRPKLSGVSAASAAFGRPALHSHRISFFHPMAQAPSQPLGSLGQSASRERLVFEAPLPEDMRSIQPLR